MKLTCVTATFNCIKSGNRENLIRCVKSVEALKIVHEHLIYDGASSDGTVELLRALEGGTSGLTVVSEPDTGIYNALNKGVRDAKGEWLYVLGADDHIVSEKSLCNALLCGENSKADVVASPVFVGAEGEIDACYMDSVFGSMPYPHQGLIMRTELVRRLKGFDERFSLSADYDMLLRALLTGCAIAYSSCAFSYYSGSGASSIRCNKVREENLEVLAKNLYLKQDAKENFYPKKLLPLSVCARLLRHSSLPIRRSAKYHLLRMLVNSIGLMDSRGVVRRIHLWRR